ncbi:MAG: excinuclease ABC subunit UvrA [Nanoarchaeota archaeon]
MKNKITIKGAREHNLKNIDVDIPRNKFVVITGISGSGKSTLAFDTIYAEGQRRYVESLSAYARQFLGLMNKPDVDSIDGLSPAISIEQKTTSKNPRSTVGTVTEIYDYLRLLFARIGTSYCPKCNTPIKPQSAQNITQLIMLESNKKLIILAPIIRGQKGTHEKIFEDLKKEGFSKVRVNQNIYELDNINEELKLKRYEKHYIEVVIDRIKISNEDKQRISDSVEQALKFGKGTLITLDIEKEEKLKKTNNKIKKDIQRGFGETIYSTFGACPNHPEIVFEQLEPRMFSFNSPFGACPTCLGIGEQMIISEKLIIPDENKSIMQGAIAVYGKMDFSWRVKQLSGIFKKYNFDVFTPIKKLTDKQKNILLYGTDPSNVYTQWEGIIPQTQRLFNQTDSEYRKNKLEKFFIMQPCPTCKGKRLKDTILAVKIDNKSIIDITDLSIQKSKEFFEKLPSKLTQKELFIAKQVLKEIDDRLSFLNNVGLGYLTMSRNAGTLSGGEAQRIRLATQIGSNLTGVLYVLDEPSIGLHQKDNTKLIQTLKQLRDIGNTLIVVEHDEDTMKESDYIIDIGPGAGIHGGHITAIGTPKEISNNSKSLTGQYLSKKKSIQTPNTRRTIGNRENKKFNIGIEIDDILINTFKFTNINYNTIYDWEFKNTIGIKPKEIKKEYNNNYKKNISNFTINDNIKQYIKQLKKDGHKLYIITSRKEEFYTETISWINKEFSKNTFEEIIFIEKTFSKTKTAITKEFELDFLIDDFKNPIKKIENNKTLFLTLDKPWNKSIKENNQIIKFYSWEKIYDKIYRRSFAKNYIILEGAKENNLKNLNVKFPLNILCGITGVSGSGKSTLINQTLVGAIREHFSLVNEKVGKYDKITIPDSVTNIVVIDQDPIGKSPRSNPATYTKIFDDIRTIFSQTKESKIRGYLPGRFSFNVHGGRCENCRGDGVIKIEMNFLPDVYVECEECKGKRYNKDTLEITYKGKNISDVLNMDVETALEFFDNHKSIKRKLQTLYDVGLSYIKLGQPATTLSGGESQRIKLTKELAKFKRGHTIYILDEPTTGLHFEDVNKLIQVLNRLVDKGNSVFVIEHNLDVIKSCDYIIDLGYEGGENGGEIIAKGTPEELIKYTKSYTGQFLKKLL